MDINIVILKIESTELQLFEQVEITLQLLVNRITLRKEIRRLTALDFHLQQSALASASIILLQPFCFSSIEPEIVLPAITLKVLVHMLTIGDEEEDILDCAFIGFDPLSECEIHIPLSRKGKLTASTLSVKISASLPALPVPQSLLRPSRPAFQTYPLKTHVEPSIDDLLVHKIIHYCTINSFHKNMDAFLSEDEKRLLSRYSLPHHTSSHYLT